MKNIVDVFQSVLSRDGFAAVLKVFEQSIRQLLNLDDIRIECCMCCCCPDGCC